MGRECPKTTEPLDSAMADTWSGGKKNPIAEARDCQKGGRVVVRVSLSDKVTFDVFLILSSCKLST